MIKQTTFYHGRNEWIHVTDANKAELARLRADYALDDEVLGYALDRHERAHVEYDAVTNTFLMVYNVPNQHEVHGHFDAVPLTFIIRGQRIFTIGGAKADYVCDLLADQLAANDDISVFQFLFEGLFILTEAFFPLIEKVDERRQDVADRLRRKASKNNLLVLSDLETGVVYLVTAAKQNAMVLQQFKLQPLFRGLNAHERERLNDVIIEAQQFSEMTQTTSQIMDQLNMTYTNVLNNELNDTMKLMTVWSLILTVPTIVTGFYGMNVGLPLAKTTGAWLLTIGITVLLSVLMAVLLNRRIK
ncbi:magnesium transporter CorA family protein [Lacticaseibacillus thailandensis]|uniref:Uncharacterized protein n=1 Tax=Lacticaseibacillus thailandensis DSM 22698 = JCM 13996 TaxID=1423810 RepID=A0A0R2C624_9LACO|nr:magnesium transporter CorA family protein [Lacticaseibacillus thailandensis]KRM87118.1 hypothetical protein FD19_GL001270 [Lacticaseibacillus thailandensis DSM 22698 = JCM 13996]